ncbi:MAG: hypothetical protein ACRD44_04875, partial [Bryobacteraceae bacterium]
MVTGALGDTSRQQPDTGVVRRLAELGLDHPPRFSDPSLRKLDVDESGKTARIAELMKLAESSFRLREAPLTGIES